MDGIDEITSVDAITWYLDSDTDGFGDPSASTVSCVQPNGYLTNNEDCNDENNTIYPSAPEILPVVEHYPQMKSMTTKIIMWNASLMKMVGMVHLQY